MEVAPSTSTIQQKSRLKNILQVSSESKPTNVRKRVIESPKKKDVLRSGSGRPSDSNQLQNNDEFKIPTPKKPRKSNKASSRGLVKSSSMSNIPIDNGFKILNPDADMDTESVSSINSSYRPARRQQPTVVPKTPKTKPVVVDTSFLALRNIMKNITFKEAPKVKIINAEKSSQVLCSSIEDKNALLKKLKDQQVLHHSFTEKADKQIMFVLKGLNLIALEELLETLKLDEIPATKVSSFFKSEERPAYLVHFPRDTISIEELKANHCYVDHVAVSWSRLDRRRKRHTQCTRCQEWGHSATNCGKQYRCVKCIENHAPGQCKRKSRDDEGHPVCVNCKGEHAANSRQCPALAQYLERIESQRRRAMPTRQRPQSSPRFHENEFPTLQMSQNHSRQQLPSTSATMQPKVNNFPVSFSQITNPMLSKSPGSFPQGATDFQSFAQAQAKLQAIPDIAETFSLFNQMVDELAQAPNQFARIEILLRYTQPQNGY